MESQLDLASRAAWLYYIGGYKQGQVAERLGVSSAKAHRLIAQAHEAGLVQVFVQGRPARCVELEEQILQHFNLKGCVVAPTLHEEDDPRQNFHEVGLASAQWVAELIRSGDHTLIGVGKGRSLTAFARNLPEMDLPHTRFVSVSGSLTRHFSANREDVILTLMHKTGGEGFINPVPYIAASETQRDLLLAQENVSGVMALARQASLVIVGIGSLNRDTYIQNVGLVSPEQWQDLRASGAISDVVGNFVDVRGRKVDCAVNRHALSLSLDDLRGKRVVAVAGGHDKALACLGALRTGILTDLILGESAARQLVQLLDGETS
ncbi:sugar-binding transcriptional regulator [Hahella sp. SMD15-11]|uniref:Sugar-binding transcriptional regulator n=1 Tax=Thermohahella caldifontis TaxID=3142973 RepID=A0AB39UXP9_9GAMM